MEFNAGNYDIIVTGAGHAGWKQPWLQQNGYENSGSCTKSDAVALMACNPAIGGTSKGHLVREVDALGGKSEKYR